MPVAGVPTGPLALRRAGGSPPAERRVPHEPDGPEGEGAGRLRDGGAHMAGGEPQQGASTVGTWVLPGPGA